MAPRESLSQEVLTGGRVAATTPPCAFPPGLGGAGGSGAYWLPRTRVPGWCLGVLAVNQLAWTIQAIGFPCAGGRATRRELPAGTLGFEEGGCDVASVPRERFLCLALLAVHR